MSASPAIDEGDTSGLSVLWQRVVNPTPGRLGNTLRVVVLVLTVVAILETFRIAEIALAAFIVLFVSCAEKASTVMGALIAGVAVILEIVAAIVVSMLSLSEPALRLPLIAVATFMAMFLARTTGALGPAFFVAGFIIGYGLTLGDEALGLALSPGTVSNTAQFCRDRASWRTEAPVPELTLPGIAQPLGRQITQTVQSIRKPPEHAAAKGPHGLLSPDAFTNPDHARFALKVTLAVMLCYSLQDGLDWPGIHTCIITCYFVSLATVGETAHKATLRFVGCLIGGALGVAAILTVMPFMTDLGHLLLLLAPVTFLCGWIAFGSERIAYAGLQIGLAIYLSTLQGFGPTLDMETARDRIVGILIGNAVIFLIFMTIWPVSTAHVVRANLAKAVDLLATLLHADWAEHRAAFAQVIAQARSVMVNEPFETRSVLAADGRRQIDAGVLARVQALFIPVSVLLDVRHDPAWQCVPESTRTMMDAHQTALANWFQRAAIWVRTGEGADDVAESLPEPLLFPATQPQCDHVAALAAWYRLLQRDILAILHQVGPHALAGPAAVPGELRFAAG